MSSKKNINRDVALELISNNNNLTFSFVFNFTFNSVDYDKFTNFYKDEKMFKSKLNFILNVFLPELSLCTFDNIKKDTRKYHFHAIKKDNADGIEKVKTIVKILHKANEEFGGTSKKENEKIINNLINEDITIYQIGNKPKDDTRIFFTLESSVMKIILIDLHHLIYPNEKYNQNDYKHFHYSLNLR